MDDHEIDWKELAHDFRRAIRQSHIRALAQQLGVTAKSLLALGIGWSAADEAWTFPERDGKGNVIGILRRFADGDKKVLTGSKRGLYLPENWAPRDGRVFTPEGVSDVAAMLSHGLPAVGRPSCNGGLAHLQELFEGQDIEVVVVGENDQKADGHWPGRDGAIKVSAGLVAAGITAVWTLPPAGFKDSREFLTKEGSHDA